ncbi:MAG: NAD-dependent epimerase/dehydratase family protein [Chloroflexi bacterium]|nr:NAD-dependent epimerase/dehydratase family protein [Chloroflexota bacterium]
MATVQDPTTETIDGTTYGGLKALCERAAQTAFPTGASILRLGYVVGPHDHTDRWTSWIRRASRGGEMLAPGQPEMPIQFIDARDVAAFALHVTEQGTTGTFNTTGPATRLTWGELFETAKQVAHADTRFT